MQNDNTTPISDDVRFMRQAIDLAKRGIGWTNPNPLVGAVIVKDGRIIGEGWHKRYGDAHAERNALNACNESPDGASVYVTLEPCSHTGKQPPCADALIDAHIRRVVIGSHDPNPLVSGQGIERLCAAGVKVDTGVEQTACDELNPAFFHYITTQQPFVVAKWAMTADGHIATRTGDARWVSGEESRNDVHELRHQYAAIMVGVNTVIADDPLLTSRRAHDETANQPLRIVCDTHLRIPPNCTLVRSTAEGQAKLLIATGMKASADGIATHTEDKLDAYNSAAAKIKDLEAAGVRVVHLPLDDTHHVSLIALMNLLGEEGIASALPEGGPCLHAAALSAGIVQRVVVYLAPKIIGGTDALVPVGGNGCVCMADALCLRKPRIKRFGNDIRLSFDLDQTDSPLPNLTRNAISDAAISNTSNSYHSEERL